MTEDFALHPGLAADAIEIARWPLSRVMLMNDGRFPWLILVPERPSLREIHDLAATDRAILIEEVARASRLLQDCLKADKINVAALGNRVPQLHIHVIARFVGDATWPNPVWSRVAPQPLTAAEREARIALLRPGL